MSPVFVHKELWPQSVKLKQGCKTVYVFKDVIILRTSKLLAKLSLAKNIYRELFYHLT